MEAVAWTGKNAFMEGDLERKRHQFPLMVVVERGEAIPSFAQVWALGFMYAVENWPEDWAPPRDKEAAGMLDEALDAIVTLTEDDTGKPSLSMYAEDGPPSVSQQRVDDFGAAIWAVYDLPTPNGPLRVSLDGDIVQDVATLPELLTRPFTILTAFNPRSMLLPRKVNDSRHSVLRDLLILG